MKRCFLYCAGEYHDGFIKPSQNDFVVAVDAGYETLKSLRIKPTLAVGDFDSLRYVPDDVRVIRHPSVKDDTDTVLAAKYMLGEGVSEFYIFGAFGKRLDHSFANIQLMAYLARQGVKVFAFDNGFTYTALHNAAITFDSAYKGVVSSFAIGEKACGVTMKNLKYTLSNACLSCDNPMGVSNEFIGSPAAISVSDGTMLVMFERASSIVLPEILH